MKQALKDAGITADQVEYINAHATSTLIGDAGEAQNIISAATFTGDLRAGSLDMVEIDSDIENFFPIDINHEEASKLMTVQNMIDFVKPETSPTEITS